MTATTLSPSRGRGGSWDELGTRWALDSWALALILLFAGFNFFWQLGSSSYFIDEAFSVIHSLPSFHTMFHVIATTETSPWAYFLFLHEWIIRTGSQAEWVTRLPSAVAGLALVWATYWMAGAFLSRRAALGAAALCALSPLVMSYAQETRAYIFLMLACVVAVGATVRASHSAARRRPLLALGALCAVLALWLHYTALSVVVPLALWVATRSALSRRERVGFVSVCVLAQGAVMPLLLEQYHYYPNGGAILGAINWQNVVSVAGTPFATRVGTPLDLRTIAGALIVLAAAVAVLTRGLQADQHRNDVVDGQAPRGLRDVAHPRLLVALGVFGLVALFCLDLAGKHILITRYTTITAPFLLTMIVAACVKLPRSWATALAAATVAVSAAGVIDNHSRSQFYAPVRQVIAYIAPRERPGDFMLSPGFPLTDTPIFYYDTRRLRPKLHFFGLADSRVPRAFMTHRRIWIIDNPPRATRSSALAVVGPLLRAHHWHAAVVRIYSTSLNLGLVLALPGPASGGGTRE